MAKAALPSGEKRNGLAEIGRCLDFARRYVGWNLDQLSDALRRDSKQVARWIRGEERCQVDVVLGVRQLHGPFVIALAQLKDECVVTTTITFKHEKAQE